MLYRELMRAEWEKGQTLCIWKVTTFLPLVYELGHPIPAGMMKLLDSSTALGWCCNGAPVLQASSCCPLFTTTNENCKINSNRRCQIGLANDYCNFYTSCKCKHRKNCELWACWSRCFVPTFSARSLASIKWFGWSNKMHTNWEAVAYTVFCFTLHSLLKFSLKVCRLQADRVFTCL